MNNKRILVIGYGNPGRLDDGLGPALAEKLQNEDLPGVTLEADYQLTVEDAHLLLNHDVCVFADADVAGPEPFHFHRIAATPNLINFTSHSAEPGQILGLAKELFDKEIEAYVLGIRGYEFNEFGEQLSPKAQRNLEKACEFLRTTIRSYGFSQAALLHASRN